MSIHTYGNLEKKQKEAKHAQNKNDGTFIFKYFLMEEPRVCHEARAVSSINGVEQTGQPRAKEQYIRLQNPLEMHSKPERQTRNHKIPRIEPRQ